MPIAMYTLDEYEEPRPMIAPEAKNAVPHVPTLKRRRDDFEGHDAAADERPAKRVRIGGTTATISGTVPFLPLCFKEAPALARDTRIEQQRYRTLTTNWTLARRTVVTRTLSPFNTTMIHAKRRMENTPEPCIWEDLKNKKGPGIARVKIYDLIDTPFANGTKFTKDKSYRGRRFTVINLSVEE